ncbi:murein biosynthesis integral membrane protein MurJ [Pseudophaeobacter arcticus]|jgi:putative peptidoglycan lipid II flippase|uniref:murein biosynthesis integral membrane protein MurJ n=1 Tax=Pseudophaeobacter arcticus TaxID=385492 RepID=UPI0039E54D88
MKPVKLLSGFMTVGFWTLASRILGFARDIMIASFLGTGPVAEAFLVAFSLPNMFRRFFAEGAFNTAFVPLFSKKLQKNEDPVGFARDALTGLATVLIVFTLVAQLVMPWLVLAMASGFRNDARFDLTVDFGRITFAYILFISLAALLSGVLNASGRFAAAAAAPVLLNIVLVGALLLGESGLVDAFLPASRPDLPGFSQGTLLVWATLLAGVAQMALVWIAASRAGYRLTPRRPRLTPDLKRLAVIAAPAMLAGGVVQINLLVGRQVASFFDGAIAWLSYADRLYQLPLGVVGIAVGIVLLPDLSRRLAAGDAAGSQNAFSRAGEISLALTIPSAIALVAIPLPLVSVLFERGAFSFADSQATALAVAIYGLGLPAFVLQKVLQPLYFAREDTRTPFRFALNAMVVNALVAIAGAALLGFIGAAIGTTVAGWAMVWQLARGTGEMGQSARFDARFKQRIWRILVASVLMGALLWGAALALEPWLFSASIRYPALAFLVTLGIFSYFTIGAGIGAFRLSDFTASLRRSKG